MIFLIFFFFSFVYFVAVLLVHAVNKNHTKPFKVSRNKCIIKIASKSVGRKMLIRLDMDRQRILIRA